LIILGSCRRAPAAAPPVATTQTATPTPADATVAHGDHNPHHGGVVLMKGELHYEVVLDPSGRAHHLYFTDAVREELPASVASNVVLTIRRSSEERIAMRIDETGESWVGSGQPITVPSTTTARVAFEIDHEPYWIDIPFSSAHPASK
jgi:hypothetical protein